MPTEVINGYRMYYEVHGQGEPFIWIHGSMGGGDGSAGFAPHVAPLSQRFRLIFFDRRAAGRSECPPDGYSMETFAEDVAALLRRLKVPRAHVLGSSAGGPIALTFALEHPDLTRTLLLINTMTYASEAERAARRTELQTILETDREQGREAAAERAVLYRQPSLKAQDPERFRRLYQQRLAGFDGINHSMEAYLHIGDSIEKRLGELDLPVFIAHGDADTTIPVGCAYDLQRNIAGSELHVVPGAGHGLLTNQQDLLRMLMVAFLDGVVPRSE